MEKPRLPSAATSHCGRSNLGGEQNRGPEHEGMTAASRSVPLRSCQGVEFAKRRPIPDIGKAVVLWEETGESTTGAAGVQVQARGKRFAEITPGRSFPQQGLTATCEDRMHKGDTEASGGGRTGA